MGCTGCNDGCFDESVQLAQGPTGETGAAASTELLKLTDSTDILEIGTGSGFSASEDFSYLRTSIEANTAERTQTTNSYSTNHIDKNIPADILVNVGDILRLEFSIIGDFALESSAVSYDFKILFGSLTVLDTVTNPAFRLNKGWYNGYNGVTMTLDLIVSAVNQMTPVIRCKYALGIRTSRYTFTNQNFKHPASEFAILSTINPTLTAGGGNDLQLQMKNSDGSSTVGLQYHSITKLIKAA